MLTAGGVGIVGGLLVPYPFAPPPAAREECDQYEGQVVDHTARWGAHLTCFYRPTVRK